MWIPMTGNVLQASPAFKFLTSSHLMMEVSVLRYHSSWQFLSKQPPHGSVLLSSRSLCSENWKKFFHFLRNLWMMFIIYHVLLERATVLPKRAA